MNRDASIDGPTIIYSVVAFPGKPAELPIEFALQILKLLQNRLRLRAVVGAAKILPSNDAVLVYNKCGRIGNLPIEHAVFFDNAHIGVVEYWERRTPTMSGFFCSLQVVGADCQDYGVKFLYLIVVVCQLDELSTAERSPECPVEDQNHVLFASERFKCVFSAACAR